MGPLITIITILSNLIILLVLVQSLMSYFVAPYHPIRVRLDRLMEPFYAPIRRYLPQTGMLDFSPMVLIILVYLISRLLISILSSL